MTSELTIKVAIKQLRAYEAIANTYDVHAINYAIGGK